MNSLNASVLKPYLDTILAERDWSWSFIAILYLIAALVIRSWFLGALSLRVRELDGKIKRSVKKFYLQRALFGWLFFFIPAGILIVLWQNRPLPARIQRIHLIVAAIASYVFSLILHLRAFATAALLTLKCVSENEQHKKFLEG